MKKETLLLLLASLVAFSVMTTGCPPGTDERIREGTQITPLQEATHARDLAIQSAIESNIRTDPVLLWYSSPPNGSLTVEVSHANATVRMKVKTQAQHDQALELAKQAKDVREITDEIEIDPNLEDPPFEW